MKSHSGRTLRKRSCPPIHGSHMRKGCAEAPYVASAQPVHSLNTTVQPVQFTKNGTGTKQKEPYSSSTAPVYSW